jgi:hypothetical protein
MQRSVQDAMTRLARRLAMVGPDGAPGDHFTIIYYLQFRDALRSRFTRAPPCLQGEASEGMASQP